MHKQIRPSWADSWFKEIIASSKFNVKGITLKQSTQWLRSWGAITHKSRLFFKVVGVRWKDENGRICERPLIEQREMGTLGFLVRSFEATNKILVQAKIEPGNVGICQIAPTFQATASNSARVHGGQLPAYKKYFVKERDDVMYQSLQSEQGLRFLGKMNLNTIVKISGNVKTDFYHRWIKVDELLGSLDYDNFINTDSRSVLVCSPWEKLVGRDPFSALDDEIAVQLKKSYGKLSASRIKRVIRLIDSLKQDASEPEIISLEQLAKWKLNPYGVSCSDNKPFCIRQISIRAVGREVPEWDQPIVDSNSEGLVVLFASVINKVLRFCFIPRAEPGLVNKVELSPTISDEPGARTKTNAFNNFKLIVSVKQSDEGGRFFRDVTEYKIVLLPNKSAAPASNGIWLTLGEIRQLVKKGSYFTNESRSTLSLLLKWL